MKLFELGEDFLVKLDQTWISTIKEFKVLLARDRGTKGDVQARKKLQAQKEFTFIFNYCDYRSKCINYSERDRLKAAIKNSELGPDFNLNKDPELLAAVECYNALQTTPALKMIRSLKEGVHTGHRVVDHIINYLNTKLDEIDNAEGIALEEKTRTVGGKTFIIDPVKEIEEKLNVIMRISKELPKTLESIEELEGKVTKELAELPNLKGGANKGIREDPNTSFNPNKLNPFTK